MLTLLLLLPGCLYLRLLELKKQLAAFDDYVVVREEGDLVLTFREPVLLEQDLHALFEPPTSVAATPDGRRLTYLYQKCHPDGKVEEGNYDIPLIFVCREGRFVESRIPQRFLAVFDRSFLIGALRSMGRAQVDIGKRTATGQMEDGDGMTVALPTQETLTGKLGRPYERSETEETTTLTWRYAFKPASGDFDPTRPTEYASFTFRCADGSFQASDVQFAGIKGRFHSPAGVTQPTTSPTLQTVGADQR